MPAKRLHRSKLSHVLFTRTHAPSPSRLVYSRPGMHGDVDANAVTVACDAAAVICDWRELRSAVAMAN